MTDRELPPLPIGHTVGCGTFNGQKLFTTDHMREYAREAIRAHLAKPEPSPMSQPNRLIV